MKIPKKDLQFSLEVRKILDYYLCLIIVPFDLKSEKIIILKDKELIFVAKIIKK
jgi:hypothetical protein